MRNYSKNSLWVLLMFVALALPSNLFAQGPNAPEAASFEPVDATDMVNLATGDLSYVLPLMNVPSPEGGYPISLSYHAGIPLDVSASWVGLGWNLNVGSINRSVSGAPDDWGGRNRTSEFFYDQGWTQEYYDFGVSANIYGINVGVGAYWGSNRASGGSVSLGVGEYSVSLQAGSRGTGIGFSAGNISLSVTNKNVSIGLGMETAYGSNSIGVGYDYNGGVTGTVTVSTKFSALGVGLNGNGSLSTGVSGVGASFFNSTSSVSSSDYNTTVKTSGFDVNLMVFRLKFNKTKIRHSLYKEIDALISGALYPYDLLKNEDGSYMSDADIAKMDVVSNIAYDGMESPLSLVNEFEHAELRHLLYPAFDNYALTGQGISGAISPQYSEAVQLSGAYLKDSNDARKKYKLNRAEGSTPITNPQDLSIRLNNRLHFYFENTHTSYLRTHADALSSTGTDYLNVFDNSQLIEGAAYSSNTTPDGDQILRNNRKRDGQFIETFTNEDIVNGQTNGWFVEAKGVDRTQVNLFPQEGIGGFRVVANDGKIYHYSLPVYNFELTYKNFSDENDEFKNFYLQTKEEAYATHWLLTAITGPDYIDANDNHVLDADDYGYWVEFEYGKWTDGYIWKSTTEGEYDTVLGDRNEKDRYEYYRGRKQIYYLDAVKTRTHTAYFVKSVREDAKGLAYQYYKTKAAPGTLDMANYAHSYGSSKKTHTGPLYYGFPTILDLGSTSVEQYQEAVRFSGYAKRQFYADFPKHDVLKLDKILLLENKVLANNSIQIDKAAGGILNPDTKGYYYYNGSFKIFDTWFRALGNTGSGSPSSVWEGDVYYKDNDLSLREVDLHISANVLDSEDVLNQNLEQYAQKVIDLKYDSNYKLAQNSYSSDAISKGKLTLNHVHAKGKGGASSIPPYKFKYAYSTMQIDVNNEDDWGYNRYLPDAWSLNEITTPVGSKVKIEYESDDFYREAINTTRTFDKGLSFEITKSGTDLVFYVTKNSHPNANHIDDFNFIDYFEENQFSNLELFICRRSKYGNSRREVKLHLDKENMEITNVTSNGLTLRIPDHASFWQTDDQSVSWILNKVWSLTDVTKLDGSPEGVIIRNRPWNLCPEWRDGSYDNDDVSINFQIGSSKVPFNREEGGIRVKNIQIEGSDGEVYTTNYYYNAKGFDNRQTSSNYRSSGITSYSPRKETKPVPYIAELPGPMVMYKNVRVENFNSVTDYEFETLEPYQESPHAIYSLGSNFEVVKDFEDTSITNLSLSKYTIKNKLANLGRLLSKSVYNLEGQLLTKEINNYKDALESHGEIGVFEETYISKTVDDPSDSSAPKQYSVIAHSRVSYPSALESTTLLAGGFETTTHFNKYDFLTGQVLETVTVNSKGQRMKTETVPAYKIAQYNPVGGYGMGSKVDNLSHRNMLTQEAMSKVYIEKEGQWKETGVGISTWNNNWTYTQLNGSLETPSNPAAKIWRKYQSYVWDGEMDANGIYEGFTGADDNFVWDVAQAGNETVQTNSKWKRIGVATKYDHYSMVLEQKDINENYTSVKMDKNQEKILSTASTSYNEQFYSGAEEGSNGFVGGHIGIWNHVTDVAHTGVYSEKAGPGSTNFKCEPIPILKPNEYFKFYKISVWVYKTNSENARVSVNGLVTKFNGESMPAGDWVLKNHYVKLSSATEVYVTSNSGYVYFDDFRMHPQSAQMTSYVYNQWGELSHILGNNNLGVRYEYDSDGRLTETFNEVFDAPGLIGGFKKSEVYQYNYKLFDQYDSNNNGVIDNSEFLDPFSVDLVSSNGFNMEGTLSAIPSGGSGNLTYRWAHGFVTNANEVSQLSFGNWTTNNQLNITEVPCTGGSYGYQAYAVKVEVKDITTGEVINRIAYFNKTCTEGDNSGGGNTGNGNNQQ